MSIFKRLSFTLADPKQKEAWQQHLKETKEFGKRSLTGQFEAMLRGEASTLAHFSDAGEILTLARNEILAHRAGKPSPAAKPTTSDKLDQLEATLAEGRKTRERLANAAKPAAPAPKPAAVSKPAPAAAPAPKPAGKTMTRSAFNALSPAEKSKFSVNGGRLVDDGPAEKPAARPTSTCATPAPITAAQYLAQSGVMAMTRAEWLTLDPLNKAKFFKDGGKLID